MSRRKSRAYRNAIIFAVLFLACVFMPSWLRKTAGGIFDEFRAPIDEIPSALGDLESYWILNSHSKKALLEAGRDLARLNASYQLKSIENDVLRDKLSRYENILRIPSYDKYQMEVARVARRDISSWWQIMIIRKGSIHGIKEGCAVISSGGVVGRISKVSTYTSVVELVSSSKFRMAAQIESESRPVIYQGAGAVTFHEACGEVTDVPVDVRTYGKNRPLRLYTSSLAGTFPEGLLIGEIKTLTLDNDGIFKSGMVVLPENLSTLKEVAVLIPIENASR